jgi:putative inorganic carbon (HCO3(-)) transporter
MLNHRVAWVRRPTLYDKALWVLAFAIIASIIVSPFISRSIHAVVPLGVGLIACLVVAKWPARLGHLAYAWWGVVACGAVLSLLAPPAMLPPQHPIFRYLPWWLGMRRFLPDGFNANVVAGALVVLLPFALAGAVAAPVTSANGSLGLRLLCLLVGCGMLAVLPLTESRAAYVAALGAIVVFIALRWPRYALYAAPVVLVALLIVGIVLGGPSAWSTWLQSGVARSIGQRMEIWSRAVLLLQRHPLTGPGFGCFEPLLSSQYPLYTLPRGTVTHAHNLFLQVAVDLGLPGLISYLSILGLAFCTLLTIRGIPKCAPASFARALALACISSLVGLCLHGLADAATWSNKGSFLPWVVLGIAASLDRLREGEREIVP